MVKTKRQEKILDIIQSDVIVTQEELQKALIDLGFKVTQSTVSRDIKELRLIKGHDKNGNYRYISVDKSNAQHQPISHYRELVAKSVKSIDCAMNDIVIKCYNGMASSVCVAIDVMIGDRMLGSVAGDDTILIVTHSVEDAIELTYELKKMM